MRMERKRQKKNKNKSNKRPSTLLVEVWERERQWIMYEWDFQRWSCRLLWRPNWRRKKKNFDEREWNNLNKFFFFFFFKICFVFLKRRESQFIRRSKSFVSSFLLNKRTINSFFISNAKIFLKKIFWYNYAYYYFHNHHDQVPSLFTFCFVCLLGGSYPFLHSFSYPP